MLRSLRAAGAFNLSIAAAILSEDADVALSSTTVDFFRSYRQGYPALSTFSWALYAQLRQNSMAMACASNAPPPDRMPSTDLISRLIDAKYLGNPDLVEQLLFPQTKL